MSQMEQDLQKEFFERFSADLPEEVRTALWALIQCPHFEQELHPVDGELKIEVNIGAACRCDLTLYDVTGVPEMADSIDFNSLSKRDGQYLLLGDAWDDEQDENRIFVIRFSGAAVQTVPYRADGCFDAVTPWSQLCQTAARIMRKYTVCDCLLNEDEKALSPLLAELTKLWRGEELPVPWNGTGVPNLKARIRECGFPELLPALEKIEMNFPDDVRIQRLFSKLDSMKYEPLFRSIWNQIRMSQQEYPTAAQVYFPHNKLMEQRRQVTNMLTERGYCGTYPDFYRTGAVNGIRLVQSHGADYVVCGQKPAVFHIHCAQLPGEHLNIRFFCGTQLLKKDQTAGDIFSCMFDTKGRTYLDTLFCAVEEPGQLEAFLPIADKKAQLKRLTSEERKQILEGKASTLALFFGFLLLGGGLFAITLITMMIGLDALILWMQGEPVILSDVPWLKIFLVTWLGFGGLTGTLTALINCLK